MSLLIANATKGGLSPNLYPCGSWEIRTIDIRPIRDTLRNLKLIFGIALIELFYTVHKLMSELLVHGLLSIKSMWVKMPHLDEAAR